MTELNELSLVGATSLYITGRNPRLYKKDNDGVYSRVGVFESIDVIATPVTYSYEGEQKYEIKWILSNGDLFTPGDSLPDFSVLDGCFFDIYFACSSIQYGDKIMFFPDNVDELQYSLDYCSLFGSCGHPTGDWMLEELRGNAQGIDGAEMGNVESYVFSLGY